MNYLILIIIGAVGVWVGYKLAVNRKQAFLSQASREKVENMEKIRKLVREQKKVTNDDVEKLLGVSNATAERYLNDLERGREVRQVGNTGRNVYYEKTQ